jgi:hypothetical protein
MNDAHMSVIAALAGSGSVVVSGDYKSKQGREIRR